MMREKLRRLLPLLAVFFLLASVMVTPALAADDPTEEPGTKMVECSDCGTTGICMDCYGQDPDCEVCGGSGVCAACQGTGYVESPSHFYNTFWALLPPIIAIVLDVYKRQMQGPRREKSCRWPTASREVKAGRSSLSSVPMQVIPSTSQPSAAGIWEPFCWLRMRTCVDRARQVWRRSLS